MKREDKQQVVAELTERLKTAETLIVADYRGLTMPQIDTLRGRLLEQGARFSVVKNTLTRRAAEAAGSEALLALLEGPTAIAFLEAGGDPAAVAKTMADVARDTRILQIRGGLLEGRPMTAEEVDSLAKLPPLEVLRGQVLGAIVAPLTAMLALLTAPLQSLHGLIDARIEQLEAQGDTSAAGAPPTTAGTAPAEEPAAAAAEEPAEAEPAEAAPEPEARAEETTTDTVETEEES